MDDELPYDSIIPPNSPSYPWDSMNKLVEADNEQIAAEMNGYPILPDSADVAQTRKQLDRIFSKKMDELKWKGVVNIDEHFATVAKLPPIAEVNSKTMQPIGSQDEWKNNPIYKSVEQYCSLVRQMLLDMNQQRAAIVRYNQLRNIAVDLHLAHNENPQMADFCQQLGMVQQQNQFESSTYIQQGEWLGKIEAYKRTIEKVFQLDMMVKVVFRALHGDQKALEYGFVTEEQLVLERTVKIVRTFTEIIDPNDESIDHIDSKYVMENKNFEMAFNDAQSDQELDPTKAIFHVSPSRLGEYAAKSRSKLYCGIPIESNEGVPENELWLTYERQQHGQE